MRRLPALSHIASVLGLISSFTSGPAAAAPKPKRDVGNWEIVQGEFAGRQTCMAVGSADQSTVLTLKLDTRHMADQVIALLFMNMNWSIEEGEDLGELEFHAGPETAGVEPVAGKHGFFVYLPLQMAQTWFDNTKTSGFWIERKGKEIGRYRGGNLAETFRKIRSCGEGLVKADPFAN
jgi:hypothetical protein